MREDLGRFWHGKQSLTVSVLLGLLSLLLVSLLLRIVATLIEDGAVLNLDPSADLVLGIATFYLVFIPVLSIVSVGIWRSSSNSACVGCRRMAQVLVVLICSGVGLDLLFRILPAMRDVSAEIRGDRDQSVGRIELKESETVLVVSGFISRDLAERVRQAISRHKKVRVVQLNSLGGRLDAAAQIHDIVAANKLQTSVLDECSSACILAFLGGDSRKISRHAKLGFHTPRIGVEVSEERKDRLIQQMVGFGVSPGFAARALNSNQIWYPTQSELEASHVVTGIID